MNPSQKYLALVQQGTLTNNAELGDYLTNSENKYVKSLESKKLLKIKMGSDSEEDEYESKSENKIKQEEHYLDFVKMDSDSWSNSDADDKIEADIELEVASENRIQNLIRKNLPLKFSIACGPNLAATGMSFVLEVLLDSNHQDELLAVLSTDSDKSEDDQIFDIATYLGTRHDDDWAFNIFNLYSIGPVKNSTVTNVTPDSALSFRIIYNILMWRNLGKMQDPDWSEQNDYDDFIGTIEMALDCCEDPQIKSYKEIMEKWKFVQDNIKNNASYVTKRAWLTYTNIVDILFAYYSKYGNLTQYKSLNLLYFSEDNIQEINKSEDDKVSKLTAVSSFQYFDRDSKVSRHTLQLELERADSLAEKTEKQQQIDQVSSSCPEMKKNFIRAPFNSWTICDFAFRTYCPLSIYDHEESNQFWIVEDLMMQLNLDTVMAGYNEMVDMLCYQIYYWSKTKQAENRLLPLAQPVLLASASSKTDADPDSDSETIWPTIQLPNLVDTSSSASASSFGNVKTLSSTSMLQNILSRHGRHELELEGNSTTHIVVTS